MRGIKRLAARTVGRWGDTLLGFHVVVFSHGFKKSLVGYWCYEVLGFRSGGSKAARIFVPNRFGSSAGCAIRLAAPAAFFV